MQIIGINMSFKKDLARLYAIFFANEFLSYLSIYGIVFTGVYILSYIVSLLLALYDYLIYEF